MADIQGDTPPRKRSHEDSPAQPLDQSDSKRQKTAGNSDEGEEEEEEEEEEEGEDKKQSAATGKELDDPTSVARRLTTARRYLATQVSLPLLLSFNLLYSHLPPLLLP